MRLKTYRHIALTVQGLPWFQLMRVPGEKYGALRFGRRVVYVVGRVRHA